MNVPADLQYTKTHEWVKLEGDTATVGITDYAQSELGDVVFIELPSVGRVVGIEEQFGSVESVKTVSELYAPLAGEIIEVNEALGAQSELINSDPYGAGWILKMRLSAAPEGLLDADGYRAVIEA